VTQPIRVNSSHRAINILVGMLLSLTFLIPAGCSTPAEDLPPPLDPRPIVNKIHQAEEDWAWISKENWYLISIEGAPPVAGTEIRLSFKEHTWLEGNGGCNRYTASYIRKADIGLQISEILSTRMYCAQPAGIMQQESKFFTLLKRVDAYVAEPNKLDLIADGVVMLSFSNQKDAPATQEDSP
jgi:heat shock protein HslJ